MVLMGLQVVICTARNAPELAPAEGEQELYIGSAVRVVAEFLLGMLAEAYMLFLHAEGKQELMAVILPVFIPFHLGAGFTEEFQLHLLELAGTEGKVAGGYLVAEGLAHLSYAEGQLPAGSALYVLKVYKDALRGLGAEVDLAGSVLIYALEGLEHHVELANAGKVALSALRALYALLCNILGHFLVGPAVRVDVGKAMLVGIVLYELVSPEPGLAGFTVHEGIVEADDVTGGHPGLRVHQYCAIHAYIIWALLNKLAPPGLFYVVLEFNAQWAVIPCVGKAAVYIRARKYKAAVITQCNYLIHSKVCHYIFLLSAGLPKLLFAFSIITRPCLFFNLKKADMHTKWLFCVLYRRTALSARN